MKPLSLADSLTINPDVVFRELDGEVVLLKLDAGIYYGLDPVGTRIWQLAAEFGALGRVKEEMLHEFEVDDATLERDLLKIATDLCANGLAVVAEGSRDR